MVVCTMFGSYFTGGGGGGGGSSCPVILSFTLKGDLSKSETKNSVSTHGTYYTDYDMTWVQLSFWDLR